MDGGDALDAFDIEGLDADALLEHLVGPDDLAADDLLGSLDPCESRCDADASQRQQLRMRRMRRMPLLVGARRLERQRWIARLRRCGCTSWRRWTHRPD